MKKVILSFCLATTLTSQAFAFRIEIPFSGGKSWSGDDPQPIPAILEGLKHMGTGLSNTVRDAIAAVGNATGISNIVDSNKKTFVDIGSGYACLATLCYSEVVKKKQLEEAEQEAQAQLDRQVANSKEFYKRLFRNSQIIDLEGILRDANVLLKNQNAQLDLRQKEKRINAATIKALITQTTWNDAMARQGIKERPTLASNVMKQTTNAFEEKYNRDYDGAVSDLNNALEQLEISQKRARQELMTEFVYFLADGTLRNFVGILDDQQKKITNDIVDLESKIRVNQAKILSAQAKLLQLKGS